MSLPQQQSRPSLKNTQKDGSKKSIFRIQYFLQCFVFTALGWFVVLFYSHSSIIRLSNEHGANERRAILPHKRIIERTSFWDPAWDDVVLRARAHKSYCQHADANFHGFDHQYEMLFGKENQTLATLPPFGIIDAIADYKKGNHNDDVKWQCRMPPETECQESQLTVIFMAYNPDRLGITLNQIKKLTNREAFRGLVKECVVVWNGPRSVDESNEGKQLLDFAKDPANSLRIVYPLKMGFPNDLMNRYHPDVVKVTTKAILYYDDDGPFYSYKAIESGFELWKRNSRAQIGAMSRKIDYSPRQQEERQRLDPEPNDKHFISHCDNLQDKVEYNFRFFANYDANMVLPSGSMLHSNYLCFLWHPALEEIRQFVLAHPVHPDDITVSTVVSHLAARAPKVYSRRLNPDDGTVKRRGGRRLEETDPEVKAAEKEEENEEEERLMTGESEKQVVQLENSGIGGGPAHEKGGIGGICWDCGSGMSEKKQIWADLRSQAINSLIKYFGSINSGSIGWCEGTEFYDPGKEDGHCKPTMARIGWLPWMKEDGSPKEKCP